jgi:hypothetical protein
VTPGELCALMLPGCHRRVECTHHRRLKSQGGHEGPTIRLCHHCHNGDGVHQHVDWANRHGLILRTGDDPTVLVTSCPLSCEVDHR